MPAICVQAAIRVHTHHMPALKQVLRCSAHSSVQMETRIYCRPSTQNHPSHHPYSLLQNVRTYASFYHDEKAGGIGGAQLRRFGLLSEHRIVHA